MVRKGVRNVGRPVWGSRPLSDDSLGWDPLEMWLHETLTGHFSVFYTILRFLVWCSSRIKKVNTGNISPGIEAHKAHYLGTWYVPVRESEKFFFIQKKKKRRMVYTLKPQPKGQCSGLDRTFRPVPGDQVPMSHSRRCCGRASAKDYDCDPITLSTR